jgi:hypothetical protein
MNHGSSHAIDVPRLSEPSWDWNIGTGQRLVQKFFSLLSFLIVAVADALAQFLRHLAYR